MTDADRKKVAAVTATLTGDLSGVELEINKELVLSTAHLPSEDFIDKHDTFSVYPFEHGWRVFAVSGDFPEEMQPAIDLAQKNDCEWITYDSDGPVVPGLRKWEW